jgi:hypothetical protein
VPLFWEQLGVLGGRLDWSSMAMKRERLCARTARMRLCCASESTPRQLCWVSEFKELTDSVAASALVHLGAIAPRVAPRDLELRKRIEAGVREAQNGMAADMRRLGDDLKGKDGKAA